MKLFFWKKMSPSSRGGRALRRRSEVAFASVGFVRKKAVSLLTELENVGGWFSTKVPPLRGFLFDRDPRRRRARDRKPVVGAQNQPSHSFFSKKTN
ncbi:MAG: hypothetical protein D6714_00390 [Bacteroidetes bacterium]|nr:MAG: hypothetical protein D6714_00390 [Bacteroidota bacterium]